MPALAAHTRASARSLLRAGVSRGLLLLLLAGAAPAVPALGVGEPVLLSAYAQPLRVRVPLNLDSRAEVAAAGDIRAEVLPEPQYARYGVNLQNLDPSGIRAVFQPNSHGGEIVISSDAPIHELATILLLRVRLGDTQIVKQVPLLFELDLPLAATPL